MLPNMNNKQMKRAMKQMGIEQEEIEATEVVIKTPEEKIIFKDPGVAKVDMMGQKSFQVTGKFKRESLDVSPSISDEDVETVVDQTGVSEERAKEAIEDANGDLAEAIMNLKG